ncbi:energy transducer TonB [Massilia sp. erpn]|uniref:energy transducer TonB n=1 Tax=Massilia sp. erpn TaxID=2738142 RepID=UPI0021041740|nr:energy transducer TonB [Massilia sp. erpn]UTY57558.1 energy transducer TonB [Massilia sp. erpn]
MNTMTISASQPSLSHMIADLWQEKGAKISKLTMIAVAHLGLFYGLQSGMMRDAVQMLPQVVEVTFVAAPEPPKPAPAPKLVEVATKAPVIAPPPLPIITTPVENTITVQHTPPKPSEAAPSAPAMVVAPAAPPAPPVPATPRTVTGVEYIRAPQPVYPSISRRMGESGVVTLRVLISEKGLPEQATVQKSSGSSNLDEAGRQAAMRSLFKPFMEDGKPVPVYVLVPINFQLS